MVLFPAIKVSENMNPFITESGKMRERVILKGENAKRE